MLNTTALDETAQVEIDHGPVNALDIELCDALIDQLRQLEDSECRAIVLRSCKSVFSAGIDLKRWLREGPEYVRPFMIRLEDLFATVYSLGKPIISRISGPAIAGGCMIATATDYRIITPAAKIGILESRIGVPLPMTAIEILRDVCSTAAFRRIISTGSTYTGTAAVAAGLADEVAVDELLDASCNRAARQFADLPPAAFQMTKRQRIEPVIARIRNNHQLLFDDYMQIWESGTTREAIRRYVEQRLQ